MPPGRALRRLAICPPHRCWWCWEYLKHRRGKPGTYSVLAAMGPGFCSEIVLLRW